MYQQQGDVLIKRIDRLPNGDKVKVPCVQGRLVLAEGEATGHAHEISGQDIEQVEMFRVNGELFLDVKGHVVVRHEEHKDQDVSPGIYRVDVVREVDPFTEEVRRIRD